MRRLVERHGAKLNATFTPSKIDMLYACCDNTFDVDVAEYIYGKMSQAQPPSWTVSSRSKMSARAYYGIYILWWMTGKPHFVGKRLRAFYGSTLLHDMVQEGHLSRVKWLLEKGADPKIKNHGGETPLTIAQRLGYGALAKFWASTESCLCEL